MLNKKGFTLMELMVVVIIMAALAGIAYPVYTKSINKSRLAEALSLVEIVREAQLRNRVIKNAYFSGFVPEHTSGKTRLIKTGNVSVDGGVLVKDDYTVRIGNASGSGQENVPNGCIMVTYKESLFTVYAHVEDSKIWCTDFTEDKKEICGVIPKLEPDDTNNCPH